MEPYSSGSQYQSPFDGERTPSSLREPNVRASRRTKRQDKKAQWQSADEENFQSLRLDLATTIQHRNDLLPADRRWEDGRYLLRDARASERLVIMLQHTPMGSHKRAKCRLEDCLKAQDNTSKALNISESHRFCVERDGPHNQREYYHTGCFLAMLDQHELLRSGKFILGDRPWEWGLMIRKWYICGGILDLENIATYIKDYHSFMEQYGEVRHHFHDWAISNLQHADTTPYSGFASPPVHPYQPVLTNTNYESICTLTSILQHPLVEEMRPELYIATDSQNVDRSLIINPEKEYLELTMSYGDPLAGPTDFGPEMTVSHVVQRLG